MERLRGNPLADHFPSKLPPHLVRRRSPTRRGPADSPPSPRGRERPAAGARSNCRRAEHSAASHQAGCRRQSSRRLAYVRPRRLPARACDLAHGQQAGLMMPGPAHTPRGLQPQQHERLLAPAPCSTRPVSHHHNRPAFVPLFATSGCPLSAAPPTHPPRVSRVPTRPGHFHTTRCLNTHPCTPRFMSRASRSPIATAFPRLFRSLQNGLPDLRSIPNTPAPRSRLCRRSHTHKSTTLHTQSTTHCMSPP